MGLDGFVWWYGVVENRVDPLKLGRCQVRIFNWHTEDKALIPTADLPWAHPIFPLNATAPYAPKEGDWIMGFFMDSESAQYPVMMGVVPGIPEIATQPDKGFADPRSAEILSRFPRPPASRSYAEGTGVTITEKSAAERYPNILNQPTTPNLARNEDLSGSFIEERKNNVSKAVPTALDDTWDEPATEYNPVYPFNKVSISESGHIHEIDDTPGKERLHTAHRSGTFEEIYPNGSRVTKVVKNDYQIIMADENVLIMGTCNITINGKAKLYIKSDYDVKVDGDMNVTVKGNLNTSVTGDIQQTSSGETNLNADGNMTLVAPKISLNP